MKGRGWDGRGYRLVCFGLARGTELIPIGDVNEVEGVRVIQRFAQTLYEEFSIEGTKRKRVHNEEEKKGEANLL